MFLSMSLSKIPPKAFLSRQFARKSRTQVLSGLKLFFLRNPPTSASPHASRRRSLLPCPKNAALSSFPFEGKKNAEKTDFCFVRINNEEVAGRSEKGSGFSLFHFPPTLEKTQRSAAYFFSRRMRFGGDCLLVNFRQPMFFFPYARIPPMPPGRRGIQEFCLRSSHSAISKCNVHNIYLHDSKDA